MGRPAKLGEAEAFAETFAQAGTSPTSLHWEKKLPAPVAAASVRALAHLGASDDVLAAIATYGPDSRSAVVKELLRAAPLFDATTFAARVFSQSGCKKIDLTKAGKPEELCLVAAMSSLQELKFGPWKHGADVALLAGCPELKSLTADRVHAPQLSGLELLTSLEHLTMYWGDEVEDIQALSPLTQLTTLHLHSMARITDLQPLAPLTKVHTLSLTGAEALGSIDGLESMTSLERIYFRANDFTDISALSALPKVNTIELSNVHKLQELSPLATLTTLRTLNICYANQLKDITPLGALTSLEHLELGACNQVTDLAPLAALKKLRSLSILGLENVTSLHFLQDMKELRVLNICHCEKLTDLSALHDLPMLHSISMSERLGHPKDPVFQERKDIALTIY